MKKKSKKSKKFTVLEIILMILIGIRIPGQILHLFVLSGDVLYNLIINFIIALIIAIIYCISFYGVFKKRNWGKILILVWCIIDIISAIIYTPAGPIEVQIGFKIGAILYDLGIIILSIFCLKKKK